MNNSITTPLLFLFLLSAFYSNAQQDTYPVLSTSVETTCLLNCLGEDSIYSVTDSTSIQVVMTVNLFQATGISSFHVKLGTTSGGPDLLNKSFSFDVFGNVGNGCSYNRIDDTVILGLGDFNGLTSYFSEVVLERTDQTLTEAIVFNR